MSLSLSKKKPAPGAPSSMMAPMLGMLGLDPEKIAAAVEGIKGAVMSIDESLKVIRNELAEIKAEQKRLRDDFTVMSAEPEQEQTTDGERSH